MSYLYQMFIEIAIIQQKNKEEKDKEKRRNIQKNQI